jgi:hypothetical protein
MAALVAGRVGDETGGWEDRGDDAPAVGYGQASLGRLTGMACGGVADTWYEHGDRRADEGGVHPSAG